MQSDADSHGDGDAHEPGEQLTGGTSNFAAHEVRVKHDCIPGVVSPFHLFHITA